MQKVKELWHKLISRLKKTPKSTQSKAFVRVLQFFALMLVLTIFARGAAGVTMARVTAKTPGSAEISNTVKTSGSVVAQGTTDVEIASGLTVTKIHAQQGATVKEGSELVEFDTEAMGEELTRQELALKSLEIELRELRKADKLDTDLVESAQKALDRAKSARDTANSEANTAKSALDTANGNLASKGEERQKAQDAFDAENAKPEDEKNKEWLDQQWEYLNTLHAEYALLEEAVASAKVVYDGAKANAATQQEMVDDAEDALVKARESQAEAAEQQQINNEKKNISITLKELEVKKQQEKVDNLKTAINQGGVITAPCDGVVALMPFEEGGVTAEDAVVRITTAVDGYIVECQVPQKDSVQLQVGGKLMVKRAGYYYSSEAPIYMKSVPDAMGNVTLRGSLAGGDWTEGELLEVEVVLSRQQYGTCVPLGAVHSNANGDYVLVLRDEKTILGEQTVAREMYVTVLAKDKDNVAVDGIWGEQVLVDSTKPVNDGDRVRVEDSLE